MVCGGGEQVIPPVSHVGMAGEHLMLSVPHARGQHARHTVLYCALEVGAREEGVVVDHLVAQHQGQGGHQQDGHQTHLYTYFHPLS